jgi:hypothetical protein
VGAGDGSQGNALFSRFRCVGHREARWSGRRSTQ